MPTLSPTSVLLVVAVVAYAVTFSYLTLLRYAAFEARALDMGNLNQAIWNTAHGNWFHLTNQPGTVNRLSLHVEPILLPIALLYRLYPQPPLLLVLQAVVVALGAIPLFALARYKLASEWAALVFAILYLLNPTIQAANWLEFHPVTLAPTFLLAAFYYLIRNQPGRFALFAVLAASCKEEIALLVFMLGLYTLIIRRRPRWGLITMGLSMTWALLAVFGFQQLFADGNIHWNRYAYLGDSPSQMVWSLITRLDLVWAQLIRADAGGYLWSLLWPTGFLALFAPEVLLLSLPSLAINLLADFAPMHQTHTLIYAAPIVPFVFAAAVSGLVRLTDWIGNLSRSRLLQEAAIPFLALVILLLGVIDQQAHGYLPGSGNFMSLTVTEHHRRAQTIIEQIPADAAVSAQDRLNPHVSGRETSYIFPRVEDERTGDADTVFVDVTGPAWPQHPNDLRASVDALLAEDFGVAAADDGYLLLRRGLPNKTFPASFYSAWRAPDAKANVGPNVQSNVQVDMASSPNHELQVGLNYGGVLELLDFQMTTDRYGEVVAEMTWMPLTKIETELRFYVAYVDTEGAVLHDSEFYQPVNVLWYPTTLWEPGVPVHIRTLPWRLEVDQFVPLVGLYTGENWAEGEPLAITPTDSSGPSFPLLQGGKVARLGGYLRDEAGEWQLIEPTSAPTPQIALDVEFGGMIDLLGADLPASVQMSNTQAGEELPFTLHWRASAPIDFDYTAFAHLLDAQGNKVAQLDWQPHDRMGLLPTSAWPQDWPVTDSQRLPLPPDLAPGEYTLLIGFYNWQSGERLPTRSAEGVAGDSVRLPEVRIE